MSTPHNAAQAGEIAKTVLMPGDPLRAKFLAETYLDHPVCFNTVRGMLGYTGLYRGEPVSVMGSGMGMPSMGIYSYELFHFYDVDRIIRVGSAGAIDDGAALRDVVAALGACTNSNYAGQYRLPGVFAPVASYSLLERAAAAARDLSLPLKVGNVLSSDTFYDDAQDSLVQWKKMGVLAVEMESAALYCNAARAGKQALSLLTISDCPLRGDSLSAAERETSFTQMMELALRLVEKGEKG